MSNQCTPARPAFPGHPTPTHGRIGPSPLRHTEDRARTGQDYCYYYSHLPAVMAATTAGRPRHYPRAPSSATLPRLPLPATAAAASPRQVAAAAVRGGCERGRRKAPRHTRTTPVECQQAQRAPSLASSTCVGDRGRGNDGWVNYMSKNTRRVLTSAAAAALAPRSPPPRGKESSKMAKSGAQRGLPGPGKNTSGPISAAGRAHRAAQVPTTLSGTPDRRGGPSWTRGVACQAPQPCPSTA